MTLYYRQVMISKSAVTSDFLYAVFMKLWKVR